MIAVHLQPAVVLQKGLAVCGIMTPPRCLAESCCFPWRTWNSDVNVHGDIGVAYHAYIAVINVDEADGISEATFGIEYTSSVRQFLWTNCGDAEFPGEGWPDSGGGNRITFNADNCQNEANGAVDVTDDVWIRGWAPLGWFYVYAYDDATFSVTARWNDSNPTLTVKDCAGMSSQLLYDYLGLAGFGASTGFSPCGPPEEATPVEQTTWGRIKRSYAPSNR